MKTSSWDQLHPLYILWVLGNVLLIAAATMTAVASFWVVIPASHLWKLLAASLLSQLAGVIIRNVSRSQNNWTQQD